MHEPNVEPLSSLQPLHLIQLSYICESLGYHFLEQPIHASSLVCQPLVAPEKTGIEYVGGKMIAYCPLDKFT